MDDEELTRLAIAELVREMGEVPPDPKPLERKINPIAKPNKHFLGRTLNSIESHNKREKERTHRNCQRKLQELDDNRRRYDERDLTLSSSSTDEDNGERGKRYHKSLTRKRRSDKRERGKTKKSKSKRRASSSDSSSSSRSSTSSSSHRSRKHKKHKKHKKAKAHVNKYEQKAEVGAENANYEPYTNFDMNLNPALWLNCYGEQQMQQLMQYNKLLEAKETAENKDLLEELQISDVDAADQQQQIEKASISTAASGLSLDEDSSSAGSGILQISVSSGSSSSSGSAPAGYKIMRKNRLKKRQGSKKSSPAGSGGGANCIVLDLDSDNSKASKAAEKEQQKQDESEDCICIASAESSANSDADEKESSTNSSACSPDSDGVEGIKISYAAAEAVMLLTTSSDSEIEIVDIVEPKSPEQDNINMTTEAISSSKGDDAVNEPSSPKDAMDTNLSTASRSAHPFVEFQVEQERKNDTESECEDLQMEQQQNIESSETVEQERKNGSESECEDLQMEQQQNIESSETISDSEPRNALNAAAQSPISSITTAVSIYHSVAVISPHLPVELQGEEQQDIGSESVAKIECGKWQREQQQKSESCQLVSDTEPRDALSLTAQSSVPHLDTNAIGSTDLSATATSPHLQIDLQAEQQKLVESEPTSVLKIDAGESSHSPVQTSILYSKRNVIVGIDLSTKTFSPHSPVELQSKNRKGVRPDPDSDSETDDEDLLSGQQNIGSESASEIVAGESSTSPAQPNVEQTQRPESRCSSNFDLLVSSSNSNPIDMTFLSTTAAASTKTTVTTMVGMYFSTEQISPPTQVEGQQASEQLIGSESLPQSDSVDGLDLDAQSHLKDSGMTGTDLSTKSSSPQSPVEQQIVKETVLEREFPDSSNLSLESPSCSTSLNTTIPRTTEHTPQTITTELENTVDDVELSQSITTISTTETATNLMVVRKPSPTSPNETSYTTLALSQSSKETQASKRNITTRSMARRP